MKIYLLPHCGGMPAPPAPALITGASKQTALRQVLQDNAHPSGQLRAHGKVFFYVDQAAHG